MTQRRFVPSETDLREIFALFSSPTEDERVDLYRETSDHFFANEKLEEEYSLTQEKREFAVDAWRAVMSFLARHGFDLRRGDETFDVGLSSGYMDERLD